MTGLLLSLFISIAPAYDFLNVEPYYTVPTATDTGVAAINRNPAGLTAKRSFLFATKGWISDAGISTFQFNWNKWGFAVNYYRFGEFEYHGNTPDDNSRSYFTPYAYELKLGRSFRVDPEMMLGFAIQYFSETILYSSTHAFYLTSGLLYMPARFRPLTVGLSVENLGFKTGFSELTYRAPIFANLGISYSLKGIGLSANVSKVLSYDRALSDLKSGDTRLLVRASYSVKDFLKIGGGYEFGNEFSPLLLSIEARKSFVRVMAGFRPINRGLGTVKTINLELVL